MDLMALFNLVGSSVAAAFLSASAVIFVAGADLHSPATWSAAGSAFFASFIQHIRENPLTPKA